MKTRGLCCGLLLVLASAATAQAATITVSWPAVAGATAYEIEQTLNDDGIWTKVGADVLPAACTGTPTLCAVQITPPATGLVLYRVVAKDATRRTTRMNFGPWYNELWVPASPLPAPGSTSVGP